MKQTLKNLIYLVVKTSKEGISNRGFNMLKGFVNVDGDEYFTLD